MGTPRRSRFSRSTASVAGLLGYVTGCLLLVAVDLGLVALIVVLARYIW